MPFTVSHIAAILPLRRSRLNFAALAIGSMSPDFSYVLALLGLKIEAHTLAGLFYFSFPVTIVTWFVFRYYLEPAWRIVFPWLTRDKAEPVIWIIALSALLGAATHLLWDSCTHRYGWPVENFSILTTEITLGAARARPLYGLLQHFSTLVGGIAVATFLIYNLRKKKLPFVESWPNFWMTSVATLILGIIFSIPLYGTDFESFDSRGFEVLLVKFVFRLMGAAAIVISLFPVIRRGLLGRR